MPLKSLKRALGWGDPEDEISDSGPAAEAKAQAARPRIKPKSPASPEKSVPQDKPGLQDIWHRTAARRAEAEGQGFGPDNDLSGVAAMTGTPEEEVGKPKKAAKAK